MSVQCLYWRKKCWDFLYFIRWSCLKGIIIFSIRSILKFGNFTESNQGPYQWKLIFEVSLNDGIKLTYWEKWDWNKRVTIVIVKVERLKFWIIKRVKEPQLKNLNSKSWSRSAVIVSSIITRKWVKPNSKF